MAGILAVLEQRAGKVRRVSLEALTAARRLADATGAQVDALLIGASGTGDLGSFGADQVFKGFGCEGANQSPLLVWKNAPAGAKSFAVTVYDPDAPTGSGWWHWLAYNIPATVTQLPAGAGVVGGAGLPPGTAQGRNDFGAASFGGACPPKGSEPHRYVFTVHALKVDKMDLPADASAALIGYMIGANRIDKASLTATYAHCCGAQRGVGTRLAVED